MRKYFTRFCRLFLGALFALSLTACGGGGGGGGGGGYSGPPPLTLEKMAGIRGAQKNPSAADKAAFAPMSNNVKLGSGSWTAWQSGGSLAVRDYKQSTYTFKDADFRQYNDGINTWLGASSKDTFWRTPEDVWMSGVDSGIEPYIWHDQLLILNDRTNGVPLEFATFGAWAMSYHKKDDQDRPPYVYNDYRPLYGGTIKADTVGDAVFTGKAHAQFSLSDYYKIPAEYRSGTANLTVSGSGTTGSLNLSFPNAYDFAFTNFAIYGSDFGSSGLSVTITDNNNTTSLSLSGTDTGRIEGSFYGQGPASEAAGAFSVGSSSSSGYVQGSFGVKKTP